MIFKAKKLKSAQSKVKTAVESNLKLLDHLKIFFNLLTSKSQTKTLDLKMSTCSQEVWILMMY